jgi:hypothetical protein
MLFSFNLHHPNSLFFLSEMITIFADGMSYSLTSSDTLLQVYKYLTIDTYIIFEVNSYIS